ncbi:MAG: sporulation initiation factor Spo0A C-terminal domain-containing protein [Oscillospiraceae bacterium]|nr:sporulation initiation factor Spo0A C-terminal domain-containing protein [Oscillospiraceae bacterium]
MTSEIIFSVSIDSEKISLFKAALEKFSPDFDATITQVSLEHLELEDEDEEHTSDNKALICSYLSELFAEFGMSANLCGYEYLKEAICLVLKNPRYLHGNVTSTLYPEIAIMFETKPANVERSMRHAIGTVFERGNYELLLQVFKNTISESTGKPTNSGFMARISELVKKDVLSSKSESDNSDE